MRLDWFLGSFKTFPPSIHGQSADREGTAARRLHLWHCDDFINVAKPIPAFPNGPFGLKIPPQLVVEGGEANVPLIRGDGSSNWTTIKTAVRRAAGESAETTADIGRYRRDPNWSHLKIVNTVLQRR